MAFIAVRVTRVGPNEQVLLRQLLVDNFEETITNLKYKVLEDGENIETLDIAVLHMGKLLDESQRLVDFSINQNSVLQFVIKPKTAIPKESTDELSTLQLLLSLRWLMRSGLANKLVDMMSDRRWIERMIANSPGLGHDIVAYSILQDLKMLKSILFDGTVVVTLLESHPCLAYALRFAIQTALGPSGDPRNSTLAQLNSSLEHPLLQDYTIDQELEDQGDADDGNEGDEETMSDLSSLQSPSLPSSSVSGTATSSNVRAHGASANRRRRHRNVSRHELQAAIASAQGLLTMNTGDGGTSTLGQAISPAHTVGTSTQSSQTQRPVITASALSDAIASVASTDNSRDPADTQSAAETQAETSALGSSKTRWASEIAQLVEMGLTDVPAIIQALEACNGDLAMVIQLLFG